MVSSELLDAGRFCPAVGSMRRPEPHQNRLVRRQEVAELDPLLLTNVPDGHLRQLIRHRRISHGKFGASTWVDRRWRRPTARRKQQGCGHAGDHYTTCSLSRHGEETHHGGQFIPVPHARPGRGKHESLERDRVAGLRGTHIGSELVDGGEDGRFVHEGSVAPCAGRSTPARCRPVGGAGHRR